MEENPPQFRLKPVFGPIGVLRTQARPLHLPRRPIKSLSQAQALLPGHGAEQFNLRRTGLFIWQHERSVLLKQHQSKFGKRLLIGLIMRKNSCLQAVCGKQCLCISAIFSTGTFGVRS
jgi:hypothetical protein